LKKCVQLVEHQSGLDRDAVPFGVEIQHLVEMRAGVDDQGLAHGLAALGGSATSSRERGTTTPTGSI
jgi:hypothetical protein